MRFLDDDPDDWTLPRLLRRRADEHGDKTLLTCADGEGVLTYADADLWSDRLAAGLAGIGVGRGDIALVMVANRIEFVLTWFALNKLGACHAPVNLDYRGELIEHIANSARARVMVVEDRFVPEVVAVQDRLPHLEHLVVVDTGGGTDPGRLTVHRFGDLMVDAGPPPVDVRPSDTYAVMFTSGSTGRSKGALLPHGHARLLNAANADLLDLDGASVYSTSLPLFHINAHMTVYGSLLAGATARLESRFSASRWLERIRTSGATHTSLLGVMAEFVMRRPPDGGDGDNPLRAAWMVPCVPELAAGFRRRFAVERIVTSYGNSEVGMVARRVVDGSDDGYSGDVLDEFYEVRAFDLDDRPVPPGELGELVVRPRAPWTTTTGYFGEPERTVESFRNLWFHTGDVGSVDRSGRLTFVDRLDDRIRRRGENIASADVEHVIGRHPAVAEVAVVAVDADERGGEDEVMACVVVAPGADLDPEELWAFCDQHLPRFAVPRYLRFLDTLPRTPTEKVIKTELRAAGDGRLDRTRVQPMGGAP